MITREERCRSTYLFGLLTVHTVYLLFGPLEKIGCQRDEEVILGHQAQLQLSIVRKMSENAKFQLRVIKGYQLKA